MKIIRMSTVGLSLDIFCRGLLGELSSEGYDVVALSSPDASLARLGKREGVRTVGVEMSRSISPLSDLVSLWRLVRVMRRERPDMVHTVTPKAGLLGMLAARMARVPVRVHTFTGLLFPTATGFRRRLLMTTDRLTCMAATHIVPEGEGVKADLISGHITRKPLRVLGYGNVRGVDLGHYHTSPAIDAEAARLRRNLGIPETLLRSDPHIHLSDGWVDDVRPWLAMADALVFPSYREGFPNVVLEAGAMERPAIVTDINGSREIITPGVNGLVVPPRDTDALRDAMKRFLSLSPGEVRRMGIAARENVVRKFSQRYVRDCLKQFYREILC